MPKCSLSRDNMVNEIVSAHYAHIENETVRQRFIQSKTERALKVNSYEQISKAYTIFRFGSKNNKDHIANAMYELKGI